MYCRNCGAHNQDRATICWKCNSSLNSLADATTEQDEFANFKKYAEEVKEECSYHTASKKYTYYNKNKLICILAIAALCIVILGAMYVFYNPFISDLSGRIGKSVTSLKCVCYTKVHEYARTEDDGLRSNYSGSVVFCITGKDRIVEGVEIKGKTKYNILGVKWGMTERQATDRMADDLEILINTREASAGGQWYIIAISEKRDLSLNIRFDDDTVDRISLARYSGQEEDDYMGEYSDDWSDETEDISDTTPTPTPTPLPTPTKAQVTQWDTDSYTYDDYDEGYDDEYVIPDSDTRKLTRSDLKNLTKAELRIARNEIYARHGRMFNDEELQSYFESTLWYDGYIAPEDFVESEELSKLERRNANFILKEEQKR